MWFERLGNQPFLLVIALMIALMIVLLRGFIRSAAWLGRLFF
jgi:hypothetical protein